MLILLFRYISGTSEKSFWSQLFEKRFKGKIQEHIVAVLQLLTYYDLLVPSNADVLGSLSKLHE